MKLSAEEVAEFQNLYHAHLGKVLPPSSAHAMAVCFLNFIQVLEAPLDSDLDVAFMEEFMAPHRPAYPTEGAV